MALSERAVTIVVVTRDRAQTLRETLPRHAPYPVVVVDNGSADETVAVARAAGVQVVALGRNAGAAGRTAGVRLATTPYVAFADDDSWWAPDALKRAAAVLDAHPRLAVLAATVLVGPDERLDPVCREMAASPLAPAAAGPAVLGFVACGAVVRKEAYLEIGGTQTLRHRGRGRTAGARSRGGRLGAGLRSGRHRAPLPVAVPQPSPAGDRAAPQRALDRLAPPAAARRARPHAARAARRNRAHGAARGVRPRRLGSRHAAPRSARRRTRGSIARTLNSTTYRTQPRRERRGWVVVRGLGRSRAFRGGSRAGVEDGVCRAARLCQAGDVRADVVRRTVAGVRRGSGRGEGRARVGRQSGVRRRLRLREAGDVGADSLARRAVAGVRGRGGGGGERRGRHRPRDGLGRAGAGDGRTSAGDVTAARREQRGRDGQSEQPGQRRQAQRRYPSVVCWRMDRDRAGAPTCVPCPIFVVTPPVRCHSAVGPG